MHKLKYILPVFLFLFIACNERVLVKPKTFSNDDFLKQSQEKGKELLAQETILIEKYIENSPRNFQKNILGVWMDNVKERNQSMATLIDQVTFEYQVSDLSDQVIYSFKDLGRQDAILGKSNFIRGLTSALQLIEPGDSATVLVPSLLAYGGYGDQKKIGSDVPLKLEIRVIKIQKG